MNTGNCFILFVILSLLQGCVSITPTPAKLPQMLCLPPVINNCDKANKKNTVGILRIDLPNYAEQKVLSSKISSCEIQLHENFEWCEQINYGICRTLIDHLNNSSNEYNFEALPSKCIQLYSNYIFLEFNDLAYYTNEETFKISGKINIYSKDNLPVSSNYFNINTTISMQPQEYPKAISAILKQLAEYIINKLAKDSCKTA